MQQPKLIPNIHIDNSENSKGIANIANKTRRKGYFYNSCQSSSKRSRKHPAAVFYLLLVACCLQIMTPLTAAQVQAADVDKAHSKSKLTNTNFENDLYNIRHGRSRVRHSNDRWSLQPSSLNNLTNGSDDDDETTAAGHGNANGNGISVGSVEVFLSRDTDKAGGPLLNDEYWRNSSGEKSNETLQQQAAWSHFAAATTQRPPVTHRIRKLHKKKLIESIRKSEEEQGMKLSKNHRSLSEAEHIAYGRQAEDSSRNTNMQKKSKDVDKSDVKATEVNMVELNDYQNDEASLSTSHSLLMATITSHLDPYASNEFNEDTGGKTEEDFEERNPGTSPQNHVAVTMHLEAAQREQQRKTLAAVETKANISNGKRKAKSSVEKSYEVENQSISEIDNVSRVVRITKNKEHSLNEPIVDNYLDSETYTEQIPNEASSEPTPRLMNPNDDDDESIESTLNDYDSFLSDSSASLKLPASSSTIDSLDRSFELKEINFSAINEEENSKEMPPQDSIDVIHDDEFLLSSDVAAVTMADESDSDSDDDDVYETNKFLEGVVDAANEDEIYDWDEISRNNRRNLMRGRDVVTKFLQIVETQHSLGSNCEAGTSLNLGEGVVDRYAQDRFRIEAEVAVNRANMLTRIFKMTSPAVQASVNLLHTSVLSMVEFDDDIFAAGNCFDWNQHPSQPGLFCPFAYRLPPPHLGAIFAKDLATEYHYLGNTSEWFFQARKNAEKVIARSEQYLKAFHLYSNKTDERIEETTLAVKYEDGRWSKPYYDCGGGNIWMLTYTVPFFGYENGTYFFKGTSGIDIDLRRVDIDQCPQRNKPGTTQPLNIFAGTDKCKQRTTMCEALNGLGFRRGSYKCVCRKGYYFPDTASLQKFFNGSLLEEEYEKLMLGKNSTYNIVAEYECLPCAEGCDSCEDGSPCIAALNWPMRTSILVLACAVIGLLPPAAWFTFRYQRVKVVRAASPALLRVIALGAFFIYCTTIVMYPNPNLYTCTARIWLREIGFSLTYGALMLKTWRISVIFRVRSAKAVKITDAALLKRLGIICGVIGTCLLVRTLVSPPDVVVGRTADDLKAFLCKTDWWDYTFTSMEVLFLAWGVRLCIMVRKAPSEFNESRFISMAIYNEFLLTCFLNVSMLFLQSPANPDLLYIIFFCHTQLTVTLLLGLIFGSKVYIVLRSGKSHQDSIGLATKASGTKFNFRPQVRTFANPSSATTSTAQAGGVSTSADTKLSEQEALEEIRQLSVRLQRIQDMAPPKGVAVMTISSLLDGLKTPSGIMMVAAAAGSAATLKQQPQQTLPPTSLPLFSLNSDLNPYNQQHSASNNNIKIITAATTTTTPTITASSRLEKAMNTTLTGETFQSELRNLQRQHMICDNCLESCRAADHSRSTRTGVDRKPSTPTLCQRLGSPQPEGSISFSNIKLDCMCSQPGDLERRSAAAATPKGRRSHQRTAATNTPPSMYRRRSKTKGGSITRPTHDSSCSLLEANRTQLSDSVEISNQIICDNCQNKLRSKSLSGNVKRFSKATLNQKAFKSNAANSRAGGCRSVKQRVAAATTAATAVNQTRSNDLLDRITTHCGADSSEKKNRSTSDVAIFTTTDDDSDDSADSSSKDESFAISSAFIRNHRYSPHQHESTISQSTSALGNSFALACLADFALPSTSSSTATGLSMAAAADDVPSVAASAAGASHSDGNSIGSPNGSKATQSNGRPKRPDKLILDLNDRSKFTKEVSV